MATPSRGPETVEASELLRVLLVEYEPADAELCARELKKAGFRIELEVVPGARDSLERIRSEDYDVVLADSNMPGWNGMQALAELQRAGKDTPFILVTGSLGEEDAVACIKQGASDYVLKESLARLPVVIRRALEEQRLRRERAEAERNLREREKHFRALIENSSDGIALLDHAGTFLYSSPTTSRILGYSVEEFFGRNVFELIHPEDLTYVQDVFGSVLAAPGRTVTAVLRCRHKDGSWRWIEVVAKNLLAEASVQAIVVNYRDITERKEAERALRDSESKYRLLFERNLAGVYRSSLDGQAIDLNDACARMFGYPSREGARGRRLWSAEPNRAEMEKLFELVRKRGHFSSLELRLSRMDGRPVWVLASASLLEGEEGQPPMIEGTLVDITERKTLEEQLRQSQRIEAVGRLAGGVAHDFNNLLTAILGYSDIALSGLPAESRLHRQVAEIKKAGERAAALTRQLLAFSRQQVLAPRILDLNLVIADLEKILKRVIGEDIDLSTRAAPDLGRVKADPSQIEQVVMNLAVNARDAMPEGGKLVIETANVDMDEASAERYVGLQPGRYVALAVSDTGCGMDAETKSRIFEPFFTTKEKGKGTGLGLSTVYGIVKQSGGYIWADSEVGRGTTFKVYLPRVTEKADEARPAEPPPTPARGSETILLVEDEEAVRQLVRRVLCGKGYHVLEASRGDEALKISEQYGGAIRLVLTDMVMPHMNGRELARRLVRRHPETRVIFMSGYTGEASGVAGLGEASATFLQKPFTSDELIRKVRATLDQPAV